MNFLEQLAAEWFDYQGYFIRTNIKFGKLKKGGYQGEIDLIAYHPENNQLIHVETSTGGESFEKRKKIFLRKFDDASKHYEDILPFVIDKKIEIKRRAIVGFAKKTRIPVDWPKDLKIKFISVPAFISKICKELTKKNPSREIVPESYPLLRTIQLTVHYYKPIS